MGRDILDDERRLHGSYEVGDLVEILEGSARGTLAMITHWSSFGWEVERVWEWRADSQSTKGGYWATTKKPLGIFYAEQLGTPDPTRMLSHLGEPSAEPGFPLTRRVNCSREARAVRE
jgi:hypothetical protein